MTNDLGVWTADDCALVLRAFGPGQRLQTQSTTPFHNLRGVKRCCSSGGLSGEIGRGRVLLPGLATG
jgi:hypothetical protein